MELRFRLLRADEIDCRIATVSKKGLSLLLYKDARCDQNILDETVGAMNWQRHHSRDNANCVVSIWDPDKAQWVEKEDTGTESNTEKDKGLASDSFKRSCFNWGIGRELYTAPFMWVTPADANIEEYNGKVTCRDRFSVIEIKHEGNTISGVTIRNDSNKHTITFGSRGRVADQKVSGAENPADNTIGHERAVALWTQLCNEDIDPVKVSELYKVRSLEYLTEKQHQNIIAHIRELKEKCGNGNDRETA